LIADEAIRYAFLKNTIESFILPMPVKRQTYQQRAEMLVEAVKIGIDILNRSVLIPEEDKPTYQKFFEGIIHMALHPEPPFRRVASLRYLEEAFLTSWNEGEGEDVKQFWLLLAEKKIGYTRKDPIAAVLKRKRIKDIHEYDFVVDNIVVAEQLGKITGEEAALLSNYLVVYENKQNPD